MAELLRVGAAVESALSTPHGTLGTSTTALAKRRTKPLSTPHGTLGTGGPMIEVHLHKGGFQLHTVH